MRALYRVPNLNCRPSTGISRTWLLISQDIVVLISRKSCFFKRTILRLVILALLFRFVDDCTILKRHPTAYHDEVLMTVLIGSRWLVSTSCHFIYTGDIELRIRAARLHPQRVGSRERSYTADVTMEPDPMKCSRYRGLVDKRENRIAWLTLFINKSRVTWRENA